MCEMIERIKNEAKAVGIAEGKAAGLAEGLAEGEARGEARGKAENAMNTAKVAISMGLSITQIMALTNLPENTILQLM